MYEKNAKIVACHITDTQVSAPLRLAITRLSPNAMLACTQAFGSVFVVSEGCIRQNSA
jgi:hypothetical protein